MSISHFDDPTYDIEFRIQQAEALVQGLDNGRLNRPIHDLRNDATHFTGDRDELREDVRERAALFNRMFTVDDSLNAYANQRFQRAHQVTRSVEARQSYDRGAEAARLLYEVEYAASQLIRAAHKWLEDRGHADPKVRSRSTPAMGDTTLSSAIWETRNQDEHWQQGPVRQRAQDALFAVVSEYPRVFGATPPAIGDDLERNSFAAEICFDVLKWRHQGSTLAALNRIHVPPATP